MMNDPFIVGQAGLWARRTLGDDSLTTPEQRIQRMYQTAFARPATSEESASAQAFIGKQAALLGAPAGGGGDPMNHEQAWADLAHTLLNVKEFIFLQ